METFDNWFLVECGLRGCHRKSVGPSFMKEVVEPGSWKVGKPATRIHEHVVVIHRKTWIALEILIAFKSMRGRGLKVKNNDKGCRIGILIIFL
jgi:hypothetical protein